MRIFRQAKSFWQSEQTQTVLKELEQIAKAEKFKFPWWLLTTASTASSFIDHPIIGNQALNQLGLHEKRVKLAHDLAQKRREKLAKYLTPEDVEQFQANGFILKENFLPEHEFLALKNELLSKPIPTREMLQGDTVTRRMALDYRILDKLPETQKLLSSKRWRDLINYVGSFQIQPMYYVQVILSHVRQSKPDPQTALHSDTFHSSMKAWLFLTDVAEDEGPFVYVPGSHMLTEQRLAWERQKALNIHKADGLSKRGSFRIKEKELAALGYGRPQKFAVQANTLVIADTYGFHARGESVRPSTRIEVWAFARRNPFLPWTNLNIVALPIIKNRVIPWYWEALDYLERQNVKKNPWRDVGEKRATDPAVITSK